jgi:hypothetical protein
VKEEQLGKFENDIGRKRRNRREIRANFSWFVEHTCI